jgi:thioredoxin 1
MSNAAAVSDATFEQDVLKSETPVLVDFWAEWCQPCRMMAPILDEVAASEATRLKVVKLDVDANQQSAGKYGVMSIPTLILFKGGEAVERVVGLTAKDQLVKKLAPHL